MARFTNKVALVTGGGTGIGRAVTEVLVAEGAKVVITGRREAPLKELAAAHPDAVRYVTTDVTEKGAPAKAIGYAIEQFDRLDIVVNNAGIGTLGPLVETDDDAIGQTYAVNIQGLLSTIRDAVPHLAKSVAMSSTSRRHWLRHPCQAQLPIRDPRQLWSALLRRWPWSLDRKGFGSTRSLPV